MRNQIRLYALVLAAALIPSACSLSDRPGRATLPTELSADLSGAEASAGGNDIVLVTVTPDSSSIAIGGTVALMAKAYNANGGQNPWVRFTWSSSAPAIAAVSASGLVTGVSAGSATISATTMGNFTIGTATVHVAGPPPPPPGGSETLIAAGDIGVCSTTYDEATATVIDGIPGTVAALGDLAYPAGSTTDFQNCYDPSWGRHRARTRPAIGNHEYQSANGAPYFTYFGAAAGSPTQGYYSYDLGDWHIVVLNSNCSRVSCAAGASQETWLRADLSATTKACILAYWHHPRFTSEWRGGNLNVAPLWDALYQFGADVVLNGHTHFYERFGLQNPSAVADPNGIRQFIVGTGGKSPLAAFSTIKPNSQVRQNHTHGVLKLTLGSSSYTWDFVPVAGKTWTDSGTQACH